MGLLTQIRYSNSSLSFSASYPRISNLANVLLPDRSSSRELMISDLRRISSLSDADAAAQDHRRMGVGIIMQRPGSIKLFSRIRSHPVAVFGDICTTATRAPWECYPVKILSDECSRACVMSSLAYSSTLSEVYIYDELTRYSTSSPDTNCS